ncbi:hypothetical protein CcaverHIS002_0310990 [Cutaneotrichosporon cavernicola]|nr:hypothetical protein CcaverHIS002_0310990 [Cutaneotrichosporon cavernicola]
MRAAVFLLFIALAHAERIALHGDRHDHGAELPSPVASDEEVPQTVSLALASSSYLASPSAALPGHDHGHGQPPGHNHNSHAPVREVLDDIGLHEWHDFPPTYMDADFRLTKDSVIFGEVFPEGWDPESVASHPPAHARTRRVYGCVVLCPPADRYVQKLLTLTVALALRAAGHPLHHFLSGASLGVAILGWCAGAAYKAAMPDLYAGAKHGGIGNILLLTQITMAIVDSLTLIKRSMGVYRSGIRDWKQFFHALLRYGGDDRFAVANRYEMIWIPDEHDDGEVNDRQRVIFTIGGDDLSRVASPEPITPLRQSTGSDGTLHDSPTTSQRLHKMGGTRSHGAFDQENTPAWTVAPDSAPQQASRCVSGARALQIVLTWVRRTQVILAYVAVCTGIPVYVGMCRAGFINTCAAHIVKGSIFFGYGVLTFARYLGASIRCGASYSPAAPLFRFLTYCYLWLRPPTDSMLPSRPPTEVLTSFGWAAGGIVFMLSDEEVAFAAMRSGFDDMMAFLNFTVALTCLVFCWIVVVMAVKGFALVRVKSGIQLAMGDEESV